MLTQTSETAIRLLLLLALRTNKEPLAPKHAAPEVDASPTYLAKVTSHLVKAGILRAQRGMRGGVTLDRSPDSISLLEIVEACQGKILGDYCTDEAPLDGVCGYHRAMVELHEANVSVLKRWTLGDIARCPEPAPSLQGRFACRMHLSSHDKASADGRR